MTRLRHNYVSQNNLAYHDSASKPGLPLLLRFHNHINSTQEGANVERLGQIIGCA